ncbi:hypothetical protein KY332_01490 [Candidatus Woesearchaeota archaeon]|nr:hypothetical protein [Candidatus Woesearchaeota archaeon]
MSKKKKNKSKNKITSESWFYDRLINFYKETIRVNRETEEVCKKLPTDLGISDSRLDFWSSTVIEESRGYCEEYKSILDLLLEAKPFLIGPATIDSLVNTQPASYGYVWRGQLPFNPIFFELAEPIPMALPLSDNVKNMCGIYLEGGEDREGLWHYGINVHYSNNLDDLVTAAIEIEPEKEQRVFGGYLLDSSNRLRSHKRCVKNMKRMLRKVNRQKYIDPNYKDLSFEIDIHSKKGWFSTKSGLKRTKNKVSPENLSDPDFFYQIPSLCINLINYINSHNTTVVPREGPIKRREASGEKRKKKPFHLVVVKDNVVQEYEPRKDKAWELTERIYVRGHNREYKNKDGTLRMTTWVSPHVRGPPDAPFANQRYQVLAEKLLREQEMLRNYDVE